MKTRQLQTIPSGASRISWRARASSAPQRYRTRRPAPDATAALQDGPLERKAPEYALDISAPSCFRTCLGSWWGSHPVYKLDMKSGGVNVEAFLPQVLHAFDDKQPSWLTRLKRALLLSAPVVKLMQSRKDHVFLSSGRIGEKTLLQLLGSRNTPRDRRHNLVITSDALLITRNAVSWSRLDASFSKHAMVSSLASDVRFAGELWQDAPGRVCISANSGTYKPSRAALSQALQLMTRAFPNLEVVSDLTGLLCEHHQQAGDGAHPVGVRAVGDA